MQRHILRAKEQWFSDSFDFLMNIPKEYHVWCSYSDLMGPLLETFYTFFDDKHDTTQLKVIWKRVSEELGKCTQCIVQHHQAQETYVVDYESDTVDPLLKVVRCLDEERITGHLKKIIAGIGCREYDADFHGAEVVSVMFEVLMYPILLDDQSLVSEFQLFIEAIDKSHEVTLAGNQQYPGVYALLFLKSGGARAIGLRLARSMGKLRSATDLEPLQPLLRKYIAILESEVVPSNSETSRPRVQLERVTVWLGIKTLLGFLEAAAFEEGILERYPIFLSIILNHVSDDTMEFSHAVTCLRAAFLMLGCKLWLRTTLSPSMMRNTLLGQCFHTRNEKSHKEIFDLFLPFLQSLEALQDGEHEKQRRHFLYFLLHQVPHSSNFSLLMKKNARKIALLIVLRGYRMNPPSPPFECAHMWAPSLVNSLKDTSLHNSLRQPAFDLIQTIIVSDASALISLKLKYQATSVKALSTLDDFDDEEELPFSHDVEERDNSCWREFNVQNKLASRECNDWTCAPMLWFDGLVDVDPSVLNISFSKAVFWALSHVSMLENSSMEPLASVKDWLSSNAVELSSAFGWEAPKGSDDGGDGTESRNSVKASSACIPLIRMFKRFTANFILKMKQHEIQKQWTWEPRMAECLVLMLIDPNDFIRQSGRGVLEHVSKTKGLTSGLQFLCSSSVSLSAMFLGLKYALKQVHVDSLSRNFSNLHHLFFVMHKLLKDVATSTNLVEDSKSSKFSSEGGFLRQYSFEHLSAGASGESPIVVDMKSWEKFSCLLSAMMWPSLLKCLAEGIKSIDSKVCQMTCVRLLETLPIVFARLSLFSSKALDSSLYSVPVITDFKWLSDLVDWRKSSLNVIIRYWQKCMLSLMEFFKGLQSSRALCAAKDLESLLLTGEVEVDVLKEKIIHLTISLSNETSRLEDGKMKFKTCLSDGHSFGKTRPSAIPCLNEDKTCHAVGIESVGKVKKEEVIVLSDDERENLVSSEFHSSRSKSNYSTASLVLPPAGSKGFSSDSIIENVDSSLSRGILRPYPSRISAQISEAPSTKHDHNKALGYSVLSSGTDPDTGSTSSVISSEDLEKGKGTYDLSTVSDVVKPLKEATSAQNEPSAESAFRRPSSQMLVTKASKTELELEKDNDIIKELIRDEREDPLELALDHSRRHHPTLIKASASVPKRKVIQLQMPTNNKSGLPNKIDLAKRFKPPKLDEWYKSILELNYFVIVKLSSDTGNEKTTVELEEVPLCFQSLEHYVQIFRPLVLEEFKAQLYNSYIDSSSDEMSRGSLHVISVERVDDFLLVHGRPGEAESSASRGCLENDLILLTKDPLQNSAQQVHVLGKVERREKNTKSRSTIIVIRFYLPSGPSRFSTARRLITERSKWHVSCIMSITPQLREFQALSSLQYIPMLPIILNPVDCSKDYSQPRKFELSKLSQPIQQMLKSSFNNNQLLAISNVIGRHTLRKSFDLSLIQGPPGTGKTRTIVAIVSALLALRTVCKSQAPTGECTNPRPQIGKSAAIARAWQDLAFAKQLMKNAEKVSSERTDRTSKGRILICAQSNAAVDELVSRISEGIFGDDGKVYKPYIVRVGNAKTVHPNSMPFFIDTLVEHQVAENQSHAKNDTTAESSSSLRGRLEKLVDNIRYYESKRANLKDGDAIKSSSDDGVIKDDNVHEKSDAEIGAKLNILYGQKKDLSRDLSIAQSRERKISEESWTLKHNIRKSILREAEIVVTTLSGCGGDLYGVCSGSASNTRVGSFSEQTLFDAVIIDEAAQALEPATLIPLQLLKSNGSKCIMVGDPKQLPATVLSNVASKFLYECSMFERLQRAGYPVIMLTEQYRMHPEICSFPSSHFYESKLLNGQMPDKSATFHKNPHLGPYVFYDVVDGRENHGKHSGSLSIYNESEVEAAVAMLKFLNKRYPSEFASGRIGIITPYRSQLSLMRKHFSNAFGPTVVSGMEFNTVDGFQGREVDILVLSTVRASELSGKAAKTNSSGIGFVADVRRMNVALTRARLSLWIFGNARTLQTNLHWAALVQNAKDRNLLISVTRPYKSIFEKKPSTLDSNMSHWKPGEMEKDSRLGVQHIRNNAEAVQEQPGNREPQRHKSRSLRDYNLNTSTGIQNSLTSVVQPELSQTSGCSASRVSSNKHNERKFYEEGKKSVNRKDMPANIVSTSQKNSVHGTVGNKTRHTDKLGTHSPMNTLISKAKGARKFSEHGTSSNSSQKRLSRSTSEERQKDTNASDSKPSNQEDALKHSIASRKRQREAVDALLSSALIPSKKPATSSKPTAKRPPLAGEGKGREKPSR